VYDAAVSMEQGKFAGLFENIFRLHYCSAYEIVKDARTDFKRNIVGHLDFCPLMNQRSWGDGFSYWLNLWRLDQ
jgi:hypothetical protein